MPLYLGLDAGTHSLTAIVIQVEGDTRRVVFKRSLNFDRDLPEYGTTGGVQLTDRQATLAWADALDRLMGRLAAAAEIDIDAIRAISGAAIDHGDVEVSPYALALDPSIALARQLPRDGAAVASLSAYLQSLLVDRDGRLAEYWRKRYALPRATVMPWAGGDESRAIGSGVIGDGVLAVSFGTNDVVLARTHSLVFRNGALARDWLRLEHRLSWDDVAMLLTASPGNEGGVMLPWVEREDVPEVARAGVRRFGFDRHDAGRNVRGLIEGQLMAMANHAAAISDVPVIQVMASGGAAVNHAILQVMANVFGADVYRLEVDPPAALGAALRAYHADRRAAGEAISWEAVVSGFTAPQPGHRVSPNPKYVAMYAELRKYYALLEHLHKDRAPIC